VIHKAEILGYDPGRREEINETIRSVDFNGGR
jgi:hypothetical protein